MKIAHRCLFAGSLVCEPHACREEGDVNFELSGVVELDHTEEKEVVHRLPIRFRASGELGARALDDFRPGDRILVSGERAARDAVGEFEMEAYEILARAPQGSQKNIVVPSVWAVAEGRP